MTGHLRTIIMIAATMLAALTVMMPGLPAAADDSWGGTWFLDTSLLGTRFAPQGH